MIMATALCVHEWVNLMDEVDAFGIKLIPIKQSFHPFILHNGMWFLGEDDWAEILETWQITDYCID